MTPSKLMQCGASYADQNQPHWRISLTCIQPGLHGSDLLMLDDLYDMDFEEAQSWADTERDSHTVFQGRQNDSDADSFFHRSRSPPIQRCMPPSFQYSHAPVLPGQSSPLFPVQSCPHPSRAVMPPLSSAVMPPLSRAVMPPLSSAVMPPSFQRSMPIRTQPVSPSVVAARLQRASEQMQRAQLTERQQQQQQTSELADAQEHAAQA